MLKFNLPEQKEQAIKAVEIAKKGYVCKIEKAKSKRTIQQNKYYFGVVLKILSNEIGYTTDELHQVFTKEYLSYEKKKRVFVRSTTSLNTKEFGEYLDKVIRWCSENGYYIPDPGEVTEEIFANIQDGRF